MTIKLGMKMKRNRDGSRMALSKSGYIKAVAVHMKTSLGRPMENAEEIVRQVKQYEAKNPDLIVFGELSISGYSCGDLFLQSFMEEQCRMAITYLCDNLPQSDTLIAVGAPLRKDGMLFNTALIFKKAKTLAELQAYVKKQLDNDLGRGAAFRESA